MKTSSANLYEFSKQTPQWLGTRVTSAGDGNKRVSVPLASQKFLKMAAKGELAPHYFPGPSDPFIAERLAEDTDRRFNASVLEQIIGLAEKYDAIASDPDLRPAEQLKELEQLKKSDSAKAVSQLLRFLKSPSVNQTTLASDEIMDLTSKLENIRDLKLAA